MHAYMKARHTNAHTQILEMAQSHYSILFEIEQQKKVRRNVQEMFKYFHFDGHNYVFKYLLEFILFLTKSY